MQEKVEAQTEAAAAAESADTTAAAEATATIPTPAPNIRFLTTINSIYSFFSGTVTFFWAVYMAQIGLSGFEIGLIFSVSTISGILFTLPMGVLNDRIRSKHLVTLAILLVALKFFSISYLTSFLPIFLLFVVGSLANYLFAVSMDSLFFRVTGKHKKEGRIGVYLGFNFLAMALGVIVGGSILESVAFGDLLRVCAALFFSLALLSLLLPQTNTFKFEAFKYKKDVFKKDVLIFIGIILLFAIHFGAETTSYGLFLKNNLNLSFGEMGLYMGSAVFVMLFTALVAARFVKKNTKTLLLVGLILTSIGHIVMTNSLVEFSLAGRIIHEIGDATLFVFLYFGISELFPLERIGGNTSLLHLTQIVGGFAGALVFGPLGESIGYHWPLIISGLTSFIALFLTIYFYKLISKSYEHRAYGYERQRKE